MRKIVLAGLVLLVALCGNSVGVDVEAGAASGEALRIRLDLKDGSSLLGTPLAGELRVSARYGWDLDVPIRWISSFSFNPGATNAVLHLQDGDQLSVQMRDPSIKLESLLGVLEIQMASVVSMTVVPAQADLPLALRNGLLAFYTFSTDEGNRVTDHSGTRRNGNANNTEWTPDGKVGGAMRFGPTNSHVVASDAGLPMGNAPRSIAFWLKLDATRSSGNAVAYGPMRHNQACMLGMDWRLGRDSIAFSQWGAVNVAEQKFGANRWYHIVYTYNGREHTFYIDGARDNLAVREISRGIDTAPTGNLYIGTAGADDGSSFDGWLDEVMIYDRVLEPAEVRLLFERR